MKDIIKRVVIGLISGGFLGYIAFLWTQQMVITQGAFTQYNGLFFFILTAIILIVFIFFAIYPVHFKMTKSTLFVFGLALIIIGQSVLVNDIEAKIYIGDLVTVLGVLLTLLAWTNVLITDKVRKTKDSKKVEVIEV